MSFKSIDMSIAVHKNSDAGLLQRELQHKPEADQAALSQTGLKSAEANRQRTVKLEETDKSHVRDRQQKGSRGGGPDKNPANRREAGVKDSLSSKDEEWEHPYKGHHIDLSL